MENTKKPFVSSSSSVAQQSESTRSRNQDSSGGKSKNRRDPIAAPLSSAAAANNNNSGGGGGRHSNAGGRRGRHSQNGARQQRLSASSSTTSGSGLDGDVVDGYAEVNSVYVPGSKKQSLNHLLNFNYAPRSSGDARSLQRNGNHHHRGGGGGVRFNKEAYLQASCQFVVRAADVRREAIIADDVDHLVDWDLVEQIHVTGTEEPQCPICLHPPAAAKMTRCGHVYCWPCMLHYLALSDKPWRKCPICYEAVHAGDLRSCVARRCAAYAVGDVVQLRLMCRAKGSLQVMQVGATSSDAPSGRATDWPPHLFDAEGQRDHSKLLLADRSEILSIVEREHAELLQRRADDGDDCPETMFIEQALDLLRLRNDHVLTMAQGVVTDATVEVASSRSDSASMADAMHGLCLAEEEPNFVIDASENNLTLDDLQITPVAADADHFYFYQAADAQLMYMHSVNTRMLQAQWAELRYAPPLITGRILQKESCSMTEVLRKRLKYLQHLPVSSQFEVVEIGLGPDVVGEVVVDMFMDELSGRQRMRQRRAKEERKRELHIDEVNDRQIGKLRGGRSANIDMMSAQHFPIYSDGDFSPVHYDAATFDGPPLVVAEPSPIATGSDRRRRNQQRSGDTAATAAVGSFARMLTAPHQATDQLWPTLGPACAASSLSVGADHFPDTLGRARRQQAPRPSESDDCVDDDAEVAAATVPAFRPNYGSAIAQALGQKEILDSVAREGKNAGVKANGGGKKKKKNMVLFTTNVRSYNGN